ncbi:MAG TPA: hypothetical protein VGP46_10970, partial [Acidimicrobiales bacterium]|nr:hypothetical protein [Acidimicrobiales bacterium]
RNLTTLTASVLSLHPECQVLNHAGKRTLVDQQDFIAHTTEDHFRAFCAAALKASEAGKRGDYGGSILFSHAFFNDQLRDLYKSRYGDSVAKERPRCLVWKDSQWITARIRQSPDTMDRVIEQIPETRFLLPVRNPFACAKSNLKTGHAQRIPAIEQTSSGVLEWILENAAWFAQLARRHPDRFVMFYEDDTSSEIADRLVGLLEIGDDERWREELELVFDVRPVSYTHEAKMYRVFERSLERWYGDLPEVAARLRAIVGASRPRTRFRLR